jgi:septum formation protein
MMFRGEDSAQQAGLILASVSPARRMLLHNAGLPVHWQDSGVNEVGIKEQARLAGLLPEHLALNLATAKAMAVSVRYPGAWVIGGDQLLVCAGVCYDKPGDMKTALEQLMTLAGKTQQLMTAVVVVQDGVVRWQTVTVPEITLRKFDIAFAGAYLEACGERVLGSVGACQLEHYGIQLVEAIRGDWFSILGVPLVELLAFLRQQGVIRT